MVSAAILIPSRKMVAMVDVYKRQELDRLRACVLDGEEEGR